MLENTLFVNVSGEKAAVDNNFITNVDGANWFYKKWTGSSAESKRPDMYLGDCVKTPGTPEAKELNRLEDEVRNRLDAFRGKYRFLTERMYMTHPAAAPFNGIKDRIGQDEIYKVFCDMPKCGLLHAHNTVVLSVEGLLKLLSEWTGRTVYVITNSGPEKLLVGKLTFDIAGLPAAIVEEVKEFMKDAAGQDWLKALLSFSSPKRTEGIPYIWDEFNAIFWRTEDLFADKEFFKEYHVRAFKELIDDHIDYAELRCGFQNFSKDGGGRDPQPHEPFGYSTEFLDMILEARDEARAYQKRQTRPLADRTQAIEATVQVDLNDAWSKRPEFDVRVILNARRDLDPIQGTGVEKLARKVDSAIFWRDLARYQDLIAGFDFVSEEDRGQYSYAFYHKIIYGKAFHLVSEVTGQDGKKKLAEKPYLKAEELERLAPAFRERMEQYYAAPELRAAKIGFYLHDGESVWADSGNMIDAVVASYRRIGHGFNMVKSPTVVDHLGGVKRLEATEINSGGVDGPILEICPISNQLLRYFPDLRDHTAYELMKRGIQCVISSDDPQIFCNPGLTYDFWETFVGLQVDLFGIKGLLFNAYVCRWMADRDRDKGPANGITPTEFDTALKTFHEVYWLPFIVTAKARLDSL